MNRRSALPSTESCPSPRNLSRYTGSLCWNREKGVPATRRKEQGLPVAPVHQRASADPAGRAAVRCGAERDLGPAQVRWGEGHYSGIVEFGARARMHSYMRAAGAPAALGGASRGKCGPRQVRGTWPRHWHVLATRPRPVRARDLVTCATPPSRARRPGARASSQLPAASPCEDGPRVHHVPSTATRDGT
jgi:hypothetical protein